MAVNSVSSATADPALSGSRSTIAQNFDTFLQLLTTQLKNQNPLDPLDTNQFTSQLVQFSSVEQQLKTNDFLQALISANQTAASSQVVSFIGKEVAASSTMTELVGGQASWRYNASSDAANTTISVRDTTGNTVFSKQVALSAGDGRFDWDGRDDAGNLLPDGPYQIVIDSKNTDGNYVPVTTEMTGIVDGVDFSGSEPFLIVGGSRIAVSSVSSVKTPGS